MPKAPAGEDDAEVLDVPELSSEKEDNN